MKKKKFWLLLLGFGLITYLLIKFGVRNLLFFLLKADWEILLLALPFNILVLFTRGYKWNLYLSCPKDQLLQIKISCFKMISYYLINNMVSSITPFRSGELYGPFLISKNNNISLGHGFFIICLDRILELLVLIIMLCVSIFVLVYRGLFNNVLKNSAIIVLIILVLFFALLIIILLNKKITESIFNFLLNHIKKGKIQNQIKKILNEIMSFYMINKEYSLSFYFLQILLTIIGWVFLFIANYLIIYSIVDINLLDSIISQTISISIGLISMIPSGIGSTTTSYVYTMKLLGYDATNLVAGSLLSKFIFLLCTFVSGYVSVFRNKEKTT